MKIFNALYYECHYNALQVLPKYSLLHAHVFHKDVSTATNWIEKNW